MTQRSTKKPIIHIVNTEVDPTLTRVSNFHRHSVNSNNSYGRLQSLLPWSLKLKVTGWAIALSILPVLGIGAASYLGSQSITQQIQQANSVNSADLAIAETRLRQYQTSLLWKTGIIAVISGAIAYLLSQRLTRPVLSAAEISTVLVNRLSRREEIETQTDIPEQDELVALKANINQLQLQLPALLSKQETETERSQLLINLTRRMQEALSQEDLLRTTVEEVRKALRIDRVVIFHFDSNWNGTFLEESAAPGLPKILWATVSDPCFQERYIEQYRQGRVRAINNIYQANLTDCHIGLLERFGIKANLVAPILKNHQLFGLLIGHQCSAPRFWQQAEVDLFAQVATQLGYALDHTRLIEQIDKRADQAYLVINITRKIRQSLNEEDVLKTTVEEIRKALSTDRVMVYGFDAEWYGTVIAEAVVPGFPKALRAKIKDPCFAEGYVEQYRTGRVQAINDIYKAGLSACHISQLEPFAVKANLVAPILKDDKLFGLLIAHHCAAPREWQQTEIDLVTQLAMQVGYALDHARLLQRIDAEGVRTQLMVDITRKIRQSLNEEDVLKTTVEEIRKAMSTDRVMIYGFDANWYGTVIAEAVVPGFPKALRAKIKDPCFVEGYVDQYRAGRVKAINDIYKADLSACHISQLEPFAVKANLVAPILKDDQLFGLLIAHQCAAPRDWQQPEIDLFAQLAMQVGFALDHARLLEQVEQAYQSVESALQQQNLRQGTLQAQVSQLLQEQQTVVDILSCQVISQMDAVTNANQQTQALASGMQEILRCVQELFSEIYWLMGLEEQQAIASLHPALNQITTKSQQINILLQQLMQTTVNQVEIATFVNQSLREFATTSQQTSAKTANLAQDLTKLIAITQEWTENNV
ncbi:GAF domain-containing protein [Nostoc piscinale]|uniref:GAF domain-containing protein n=1 Tax=Nostoc piscinale TaxID=224012 RepID=UPI00078512D9|nr:GAF domain-containing protein [Nostoc piscinale]